MDSPVVLAVFGMLPQAFLLLYAPLGLVGAKSSLRRLIVPALILTAVMTLTRSVPALFGWHIPLFLITYLAVARLFRLTEVIAAVAAAALSFILVSLGDVVVAVPVLRLFDIAFDEVWENPTLYLFFGWLEAVILLIVAVLVKTKSLVLIPIARSLRARGEMRDPR